MRNFRAVRTAFAGVALALSAAAAQAEIIGGVEFPDGAVSFADAVADFTPVINSGQPGNIYLNPANALGVPNYPGNTNCSDASCAYVSLGDGGSLIVEFVDNRLTGSGSSALDLWIFEIGPDVEDTFVDISKDGFTWFAVGKVFGATSGIDIDAFGFGLDDLFRFVRLTDDGAEGDQSGTTVGADIDAVGAISSVAAPVPEPETWAMFMLGALAIGLQQRRRAARAATRRS